MKHYKLVGVDIAKHVFQLHGETEHRRVILRKKVRRNQLMEIIIHLPKDTLIVMESCALLAQLASPACAVAVIV